MTEFIINHASWYVAYLIVINIVTFVLYGVDKSKARAEKWRIPEHTLMMFAVFGGSVGAYCAMKCFRHKTKHPKFYIGIPVIFLLQVSIIVAFWICT